MSTPTTRSELLSVIKQTHHDMMSFLGTLSKEDLTAPVLQDGWSIKDSLAHIAAWETMAVGWLKEIKAGRQPRRFAPGFYAAAPAEFEPMMHKLNQHLFEQNREVELDTVLDNFQAAHDAMVDLIGTMSEDEIFDRHHYPWRNGSPTLDMIAGDTYDHYAEHRGWIDVWRGKGQ